MPSVPSVSDAQPLNRKTTLEKLKIGDGNLSGKPLNRGSPEGKFVVALVAVVVILAAVAFALFAANQSQDKALDEKQAELDAVNGNLSKLTQSLASLDANYTQLSGEFAAVKSNYDSVSSQYQELQNRSNTVDSRLNSFLENEPTIAYTYVVTPKQLPDSTTEKVLTVTAYNLGKADAGSIKILCTVKIGNTTSVYNQSFSYVRSMDKRQAKWEFSNDTVIEDVWAGLDN